MLWHQNQKLRTKKETCAIGAKLFGRKKLAEMKNYIVKVPMD